MTREACLFSANGPHAGTQAGRRRQRSVLRTDFPVLLAPGSCGATHCARCARFVQTVRRKSDVTKRAARADPGTALLGAADIAPPCSAPPSQRLPLEQRQRCSPDAHATTLPAKVRAVRRGRACAQPRSAAATAARAARAVHHSRGDCPSAARASERSEFRRASRCCEHRRAPPRSGGKHPARPRRTARAFARADQRMRNRSTPHQRATEQPA